jgi:hypothetical protein
MDAFLTRVMLTILLRRTFNAAELSNIVNPRISESHPGVANLIDLFSGGIDQEMIDALFEASGRVGMDVPERGKMVAGTWLNSVTNKTMSWVKAARKVEQRLADEERDHQVAVYTTVGVSVGVFGCMVVFCVYGYRRRSKKRSETKRARAAQRAEETMADALKAQAKSHELEKLNMDYPKEWVMDPTEKILKGPDGTQHTVQLPKDDQVDVPQTSPEYWDVVDQLRKPPDPSVAQVDPKTNLSSDLIGMHDAWITQLRRIQNPSLYTYYSQQKDRLKKSNGPNQDGVQDLRSERAFTQDGNIREVNGWHGTGTFDAANIYTDKQDGFSETV